MQSGPTNALIYDRKEVWITICTPLLPLYVRRSEIQVGKFLIHEIILAGRLLLHW